MRHETYEIRHCKCQNRTANRTTQSVHPSPFPPHSPSLASCLLPPLRWGQVFILDSLSKYRASDAREAESIVERVTPRLQHANCAVVLSAVKVTLMHTCTHALII